MRKLKIKYLYIIFAFIFTFQSIGLLPIYAKPLSFSNIEYGFKLKKKTYVESIKTTVMQYVHIKSGAKLVFLKNNDPNKTFGITFRTLPSDNTGMNHIIEHCVLDGSKKYPVNNALINMSNQSFCSNANGATDSDNTSYYIQTSNIADYMNFMDVILDGVFNPSFLNNRNIFLQEGGHYELNADRSKINYSGVVYGEVGGAQPEGILLDKSLETVLPDTIYKWDQGGKQQDIPDISYEKALKIYREFYKPSNSYIYLYGNLDSDKVLKYIDKNYLSRFKKDSANIKISIQKPFKKSVEKTYYYNNDLKVNKLNTYFSQNYVIGKAVNAEIMNGFDVIANLLMPKLSRAFEQKGLVMGDYGLFPTFNQPLFYIAARGLNDEKQQDFKEAIDDTLKAIIKNGIDKQDIKNLMQNYETYKNEEYLQVQNGSETMRINVMKAWLHDGDPSLYLDADKYIKVLRKELKERYLEKLIKKYLINNSHKALVTLKPQKYRTEKNENSSIEVKKLSKKQLTKIINDEKNLKKWQRAAESEEALSKLPLLKVNDIKNQSPEVKENSIDGVKTLFTPVDTDGICYYNVYFDTSMIAKDKIPYVKLICDLLNDGGSSLYNKYNSSDGSDIATYGNIQFTAGAYGKFNSAFEYSPKVSAFVTASGNNIYGSLELLKDIITNWNFEDKNRIKDIIKASELTAKMYVPYYRFLAYLSPKDRYIDYLAGYGDYGFLKELHNNIDLNWSEIEKNLKQVYNTVFHKDNLIVGFVGTNEQYVNFINALPDFTKEIKSVKYAPVKYDFKDDIKNEAFINNTNIINVMSKGYNFRKLGYEYNGSFQVLKAVTERYMMKEVRTRGGYGGIAYINQDGNMYFSTSRMSHVQKSVKIFDDVSSYIRNFKADKDQMMKYKIGAIKELQQPDSQIGMAIRFQDQVVRGKRQQDYNEELKQILNTKIEDINSMSEMIKEVIKQDVLLASGDKKKIDKEKVIFQKIIDEME